MRDSLKADPKKGPVIQKKYKGTLTSPDSVNVDYDLTLYYQQDNADEEGVFELDALYTVPEARALRPERRRKLLRKPLQPVNKQARIFPMTLAQ